MFFGIQEERGRKRGIEKRRALLDVHLLEQSKVINSQTGDCKLNYLGRRVGLRRGSATRAGFTPIHITGFQGGAEAP